MKYLKLFEEFNLDDVGIYKIEGIALSTLGYKRTSTGMDWDWLPITPNYKSKIEKLFEGVDFTWEEEKDANRWLTLHFTKPKRIPKCQVSMHEYDPADVYYTVRISMFNDDWWSFNWFGQVYATQEHMENHYKKYPHFGPGGSAYTYKTQDGKEKLSYQPAMYKGFNAYNAADSFGSSDRMNYLCDQFHSLEVLLKEFRDFLLEPQTLRFETYYPAWDQEQLGLEDL